MLVDAFVVGADAGHTLAVEQQFRSREAGEDCDSGLLYLPAQPLHELIQRDDVVAMIAQRWRSDGEFELALGRQKVDSFFGALRIDRGFLLETGKQLTHGARVEQGAGKAVLANLTGLFKDVD